MDDIPVVFRPTRRFGYGLVGDIAIPDNARREIRKMQLLDTRAAAKEDRTVLGMSGEYEALASLRVVSEAVGNHVLPRRRAVDSDVVLDIATLHIGSEEIAEVETEESLLMALIEHAANKEM
ncbi:MAG: hypothetical protein WDN66_05160 [Candidatus Saccharibacteria bacterium]